jgi:hypothetical protein
MQLKEKKDEEKNLLKIKRPKLIITKLKSKKMTLKELQGMIKEELESYMNEEEVDVDVDTDAGDIDADGDVEGNTDEDVLRKIYDMLKDKFEGGDDDMDGVEDDEEAEDVEEYGAPMEEVKDKEADLEEGDGYDGKAEKGHTGFDEKVGGSGRTGYDAGSKALQERFQKLANIIK